MGFFSLIGIAFGLAMDAFSVALASGVAVDKISPRHAFRLSFHFGLFQFGMPILGWSAGYLVAERIGSFDHWLAFALLAGVGSKMIWEALQPEDGSVRGDPTRGFTLIMLSVATSIDALAIGLSLVLIGVPVLYPSIVIGSVAASMTLLGLVIGNRAGHLLGRKMEILGGMVLFGIGLKILVEHMAG